MNNLHVEKCMVDTVKRWELPKSTGRGIVIVFYLFNLMAGSGSSNTERFGDDMNS